MSAENPANNSHPNPVPPDRNRSARNLLLQPNLQIRLGIIYLVVAAFFCAVTLTLVYSNLEHFYKLVLDLTGLESEVSDILNGYIESLSWAIVGLLLLYLTITMFLSIYYTHRLVGPTIAFRRHIRALIAGNYDSRVNLRKNDAFTEVADDLNELAELMAQRQTKPQSDQTG